MTEEEIIDLFVALYDASALTYPLVTANEDKTPNKPYLVLDVVPVERFNRSLTRNIEVAVGFAQFTVVTETNEPVQTPLGIAQEVAELFPYGYRDGSIFLVKKPPMIEKGYRDGPDWRTPIRIDYEAYS